MPGIYDSPLYYDVAYDWEGTEHEVDRIVDGFGSADGPVDRVLEVACGTGRLLRRLARRGYRVVGYDASPAAIAFAGERILAEGLADRAEVAPGDMRTARFPVPFDAAVNAINTIGHLRTDEDVRSHFAATAAALRRGGVYVVQFACAWEDGPEPADTWVSEREGIRIETTWSIEEEDRERRLSRQRCEMEVERDGRRFTIEERFDCRLWLDEEFVAFAGEAGFERVAVHDLAGGRLDPSERITGRRGNLYHVLKRVSRPRP